MAGALEAVLEVVPPSEELAAGTSTVVEAAADVGPEAQPAAARAKEEQTSARRSMVAAG